MVNKIIIQGNISTDIELKITSSGTHVISFSLARERNCLNKSGERDTDFFDAVSYGKVSEFIHKWFRKGSPILLVGELETREWTNKDGERRRKTEIKVEEAHFCGGKKETQNDMSLIYEELSNNEGLPY